MMVHVSLLFIGLYPWQYRDHEALTQSTNRLATYLSLEDKISIAIFGNRYPATLAALEYISENGCPNQTEILVALDRYTLSSVIHFYHTMLVDGQRENRVTF